MWKYKRKKIKTDNVIKSGKKKINFDLTFSFDSFFFFIEFYTVNIHLLYKDTRDAACNRIIVECEYVEKGTKFGFIDKCKIIGNGETKKVDSHCFFDHSFPPTFLRFSFYL